MRGLDWWWVGLLLAGMLACSRKAVVPAGPAADPVQLQEEENYPEWALLGLQVRRAEGDWQITLDGFVRIRSAKNRGETEEQGSLEGDLFLHLCDAGGQVLWRHHLVQPLRQRYEYPGDDGAIHSVVMDLEEQAVRMQIPWQPAMRWLRAYLVEDPALPPRRIAEIPLDD